MSITFAGVPLLLEDPGHEFQEWLERSMSLQDMRLFGGLPIAHASGRARPRSTGLYKVGLPVPNWPMPPRPKINTLWWPTGASRWGVGLFLAGHDAIEKILASIARYGTVGAAQLTMKASATGRTAVTISRTMHLLPPRLAAKASGTSFKDLWLIPLVDQRYFWQFRDAGLLEVSRDSSWDDVIRQIGLSLGVSISAGDTSGYYQPDPTELTRRYENVATLLDAVAWCLGKRVILDCDNEVKLLSASESTARFAAISKDQTFVNAGGVGLGKYGEVPEAVRVVFPRYQNERPQEDGDVFSITCSGSEYTPATQAPGTFKTFFDTAAADFTGNSSVPHNLDEMTLLANQIAADYYAHLQRPYDFSYISLKEWTPTGLDDYTWHHFGHQFKPSCLPATDSDDPTLADYACFTRVASVPYGFGVSDLLHQFSDKSSSSSSNSSSSSSTSSSSSSSTSSSSSSSSLSSSSSSSPSSSSSSESSSKSSSSESSSSESSESSSKSSISSASSATSNSSGSSLSPSSQSESASSGSSGGSSGSSGGTSSGGNSSGGSSGSSGSGGSDMSSGGSEKSTAIVPANWSATGYAALFVMESPEVLFLDVPAFPVRERESWFEIDPHFLSVCEPKGMKVVCGSDEPIAVGGRVINGKLHIRLADIPDGPVDITAIIIATRKRARGIRFPSRTQEQFDANEAFIQSAYPGSKPLR